jgi:uncharacterized membrane protein
MAQTETQGPGDRLKVRIPPRVETWWAETRDALWFLPTISAMVGIALAIGLVYLDDRLDERLELRSIRSPWLFGAGTDGARGVLTSIAGSVMTVLGTAFSITIVGLQLASSQFTPRVLRQFTGDRINQAVLAAYIGTFTYCLLVLRTIQDSTDDRPSFVPVISVTVAIVLALVCIFMLILFIHHMSQQMQVSYILHRAADDALGLVDSYFREDAEHTPHSTQRDYARGQGHDVLSNSVGYLQHYDFEHLLSTATSNDLTIRMLVPMGAYLNQGQTIARIWTASDAEVDIDAAGRAVRAAFVTGSERTLNADLPLGVRQVADIALKALSPGINDPTTATLAMDRLSDILIAAGQKSPPERILYVGDRPAVFLPRIGFNELTNIAFTQVRHYGKADLVVMLHLVRTIERVAALVQAHHHNSLLRHLELAKAAGQQGLALGPERAVLVETAEASMERIRAFGAGDRVPVVPDIMKDV